MTAYLVRRLWQTVPRVFGAVWTLGFAYVFISHDLAVVRLMSDEVLVMKDGAVVEHAATQTLLASPKHAYTRALLAVVPRGVGGGSEHVAA